MKQATPSWIILILTLISFLALNTNALAERNDDESGAFQCLDDDITNNPTITMHYVQHGLNDKDTLRGLMKALYGPEEEKEEGNNQETEAHILYDGLVKDNARSLAYVAWKNEMDLDYVQGVLFGLDYALPYSFSMVLALLNDYSTALVTNKIVDENVRLRIFTYLYLYDELRDVWNQTNNSTDYAISATNMEDLEQVVDWFDDAASEQLDDDTPLPYSDDFIDELKEENLGAFNNQSAFVYATRSLMKTLVDRVATIYHDERAPQRGWASIKDIVSSQFDRKQWLPLMFEMIIQWRVQFILERIEEFYCQEDRKPYPMHIVLNQGHKDIGQIDKSLKERTRGSRPD